MTEDDVKNNERIYGMNIAVCVLAGLCGLLVVAVAVLCSNIDNLLFHNLGGNNVGECGILHDDDNRIHNIFFRGIKTNATYRRKGLERNFYNVN